MIRLAFACLTLLATDAAWAADAPALAAKDRPSVAEAGPARNEAAVGVGLLPFDAYTRWVTVELSYARRFDDSWSWQVARGLYAFGVSTGFREQCMDCGPERVRGLFSSAARFTPWRFRAAASDLPVELSASALAGAGVLWMETGGLAPGRQFALPLVQGGIDARLDLGPRLSLRLELTDELPITGASNMLRFALVSSTRW